MANDHEIVQSKSTADAPNPLSFLSDPNWIVRAAQSVGHVSAPAPTETDIIRYQVNSDPPSCTELLPPGSNYSALYCVVLCSDGSSFDFTDPKDLMSS